MVPETEAKEKSKTHQANGQNAAPASTPDAAPAESGRKKLSANEKIARDRERHATFLRLADGRVTAAIKNIQNLGNLTAYPHTKDESDKIVTMLEDAVKALKYEFSVKSDDEITRPFGTQPLKKKAS